MIITQKTQITEHYREYLVDIRDAGRILVFRARMVYRIDGRRVPERVAVAAQKAQIMGQLPFETNK